MDSTTCYGVDLAYLPLDELLGKSDLITVHVPLLPDSRGLFGQKEFNQMKKGAFVFNLSRGPVVDEVALVESLRSGHLECEAVCGRDS